MSNAQTKRYKEMSEIDRGRFDKQRKMAKDGVRPDQVCTCDEVNRVVSYINCFDTQEGILENYQSEPAVPAE